MISIIMSTYNGERYLSEQIESILNQDYKDWKLFVFDDGSKDETEKIIRGYQKEEKDRIFFFRNEKNFGARGNFFQGLRQVAEKIAPESKYYAFSDQDDVWDRDKLSLGLSKMKEIEGEGSPAVIFSDVRITDKNLKVVEESYFRGSKINKGSLDFASLLMENKAIGGTMMINSKMAEIEFERERMMGGFPKEAKMHDWWFALIGASLGKLAVIDRATESYRQHERNVIGGKVFFNYVKHRIFHYQVKKSIEENVLQGKEFFRYYENCLKKDKKEILENFINLSHSGFLRRRFLVMRYGFWKSGVIRNIALFLFL